VQCPLGSRGGSGRWMAKRRADAAAHGRPAVASLRASAQGRRKGIGPVGPGWTTRLGGLNSTVKFGINRNGLPASHGPKS
jgi:hypothetical protein